MRRQYLQSPSRVALLVITLLSVSNWNTLLYVKATNWRWTYFRIKYLFDSITIRHFCWILEIFWQYHIFCFSFYWMSLLVHYAIIICLSSASDLRIYIYFRSSYKLVCLSSLLIQIDIMSVFKHSCLIHPLFNTHNSRQSICVCHR